MNDISSEELPIFPTDAPEVFHDPVATAAFFDPVLRNLTQVVQVDADELVLRTPCAEFDVAELRRHVLAWLQFFAAALNDPNGDGERLDPETWNLTDGDSPAGIVERAAADITRAIDAGVAGSLVVMSQARMSGDAVLAMALGEYLVHGWDLARATGRRWDESGEATQRAADAALAFLQTTVSAEHRGPDSGFFDAEVIAPPEATSFERLLCFAGRRPHWSADERTGVTSDR